MLIPGSHQQVKFYQKPLKTKRCKELKLIGARVYEKEDYELAISLVTENELPFSEMITDVQPLTNIQKVFEDIDNNPEGLKVLMDCQQ